MRYAFLPTAVIAAAVTFGLTPGLLSPTLTAEATETENLGFRLLPAPRDIKIDGKFDDWNLAAGIFATGDAEKLRDKYGVWLHGAYDADNLYLLARFLDDSPLNNPSDTKLEFGWSGDSLQVRVITQYGQADQLKSNLTCWRGRDGRDVVEIDSPTYNKHSPKGDDLKPLGARQAFAVNADGKGYSQEIAIPWKFLSKDGTAPAPGDAVVLTFEPNFTTGANNRMSIKDVFRPGVSIDRVFTFQNFRIWGSATLEKSTNVTPQPVRLSDGRTFQVKMNGALPEVDWTGVIKSTELRGFKPISFNLPRDGVVSLVIRDAQGNIVRHLLNAEPRQKGANTVQWDGLGEPTWRTPGQPVPAGNYTWTGIWHQGIGLRWRGEAANAGTVPWDNGPGSNWGGDMGPPAAVDTEGNYVLLGWAGSEAGKAAVLCDLTGKPIWSHKRGGFGGAPFVALDGGVAYIQDYATLYKLKAQDSQVVPFTDGDFGEKTFKSLVQATSAPDVPQGMAVRGGHLYFSSSDYSVNRGDIPDWRAFLTHLMAAVDADPLWQKLDVAAQTRISKWIGTAAADNELRATATGPDVRDLVVTSLNELLTGPSLSGAKGLTGGRLLESNRAYLEARYNVAKRDTGFVAEVDAASGKFMGRVALPGAGHLAADDKGVYALVDDSSLVYLPHGGAPVKVLTQLPNASAVAVDAAGTIYIGSAAPKSQVLVYSREGKLQRAIGDPGGRKATGAWRASGLMGIDALAVDRDNHLWVGENVTNPRRFTKWDAGGGKLLSEYFGPTRYGASGGAILPSDPNVMVGEACEWKLDPVSGRATCTGAFDAGFHGFALFSKPLNGHQYLATTVPAFQGGSTQANPGIKIFERLAPGVYKLRAAINPIRGDAASKTADRTEFWADANDDEKVQPEEVRTLPGMLLMGGYYLWSMYLNPDLSYTGSSSGPSGKAMQIKVSGYTKCAAPLYDLDNVKQLPNTVGGLASLDNRYLLTDETTPARRPEYALYDMQSGARLWGYLNNWMGVHGSHEAPPPETGLLRGAFGAIGTAHLPDPLGDIWCINTNVGEWHLLTRDGYYLSRLFQADPLKEEFPAQATPGVDATELPSGLGGEDFGGSLVQGTDGQVYVQSGKTALWNLQVTGLETVAALPGSGDALQLSDADTKTAFALRETLVQDAAPPHAVDARHLVANFTGNMAGDFKGAAMVAYDKGADATVKSTLSWDETNLYLGWDVTDKTPWTNGAKAPEDLYLSGDTVDFQLGTDPNAPKNRNEAVLGDFRLSIGNFGGQDTAVLYRKVAAIKKPKTFSSGVVHVYPMDYVSTIPDAKILVTKRATGYVVEASIPLAALDLKPAAGLTLRGDFGVTHGDPAGARTRLRTYWSNQQTGIVDDAVYELMMQPKNWGDILFK